MTTAALRRHDHLFVSAGGKPDRKGFLSPSAATVSCEDICSSATPFITPTRVRSLYSPPACFFVRARLARLSAQAEPSHRFALVSRSRLASGSGSKAASPRNGLAYGRPARVVISHEPRLRSAHRFFPFCGLNCPRPINSQLRKCSMSLAAPDRRTLLQLALCWIVFGSAPAAAVASEMTAPVEQLHTGLIEIMKAGKTALPPDQQAALGDAFRRYTIASYVSNFDDYSGERFEVLPGVAAVGNDRVVKTQIVTASGQAHVLAYVMRQTGAGWRVVDVLAEGSVSRVAAQRF